MSMQKQQAPQLRYMSELAGLGLSISNTREGQVILVGDSLLQRRHICCQICWRRRLGQIPHVRDRQRSSDPYYHHHYCLFISFFVLFPLNYYLLLTKETWSKSRVTRKLEGQRKTWDPRWHLLSLLFSCEGEKACRATSFKLRTHYRIGTARSTLIFMATSTPEKQGLPS